MNGRPPCHGPTAGGVLPCRHPPPLAVSRARPLPRPQVLAELINYAPFVSLGSYILVEDTWQRHPLFAAEKFLAKYGSEFIQVRRPARSQSG